MPASFYSLHIHPSIRFQYIKPEVFTRVDQVLEIVGDDLVLREGPCY